jgi:hypothetical protein
MTTLRSAKIISIRTVHLIQCDCEDEYRPNAFDGGQAEQCCGTFRGAAFHSEYDFPRCYSQGSVSRRVQNPGIATLPSSSIELVDEVRWISSAN